MKLAAKRIRRGIWLLATSAMFWGLAGSLSSAPLTAGSASAASPAGPCAAAQPCAIAQPASPASLIYTTGAPDGRMATASRPANPGAGQIEVESADDFDLAGATRIISATFTGLLPSGASLASIDQVDVEIYRVFPKDSVYPPSGHVPTRTNSPSDVAFAERGTTLGNLTFAAAILSPSSGAANSVVNGINPIPNQFTGGEGAVSGEEVQFTVTFAPPIDLPADHYFFIPKVQLSSGTFLWLSAAGPTLAADLQSWIRNANLDPDWLRVGTDIVGGTNKFNAAFSLFGSRLIFLPLIRR